MMNAEIKAKWIEALRSGKYEQGRGRLRSEDNKYCCLGVLCDLIDPGKWVKHEGSDYSYGAGEHATGIPREGDVEVAQVPSNWIGTLASRNDFGANFHQIAHIIEENL